MSQNCIDTIIILAIGIGIGFFIGCVLMLRDVKSNPERYGIPVKSDESEENNNG